MRNQIYQLFEKICNIQTWQIICNQKLLANILFIYDISYFSVKKNLNVFRNLELLEGRINHL